MFKLAYLCLFLVGGGQHAAGSPVTKYEYIQEADAWLRLHIVPATWQDAGLRCYLEGGILASPTTSAMATAMTAMMKAHKLFTRSVFTGIHDHSSKGQFVSLDGVPLADMSLEWAEGQPDNADNGEDCLALTAAGALADVSCGSVHPHFCRKAAPTAATQTAPTSAAQTAPTSAAQTAPTSAAQTDSISADQTAQSVNLAVNKCGNKEGYEYEPRTGSCYKFHTSSKYWRSALSTCHTEGGYLAIINNETESQVFKEMLEKYRDDITDAFDKDYASIGLWHMNDATSMWLTIHGDTLQEAGFDKWSSDEPSDDGREGDEQCGSIFKDGLLNDISCGRTEQLYPFICEFAP